MTSRIGDESIIQKRPSRAALRILVVCSANRGRSPAATYLLQDAAAKLKPRRKVIVRSAGLSAQPGQEMLASMRDAMQTQRLPVNEHRSRTFDIHEARRSHLVITMTEEQRRTVTRSDPTLIPKTFTLLELARLVASPQWKPEWNGTDDVVARIHRMRPHAAAPAKPEDVNDPLHGGSRMAASVLGKIDRAVQQIARPLFGDPRH